MSGNYLPLYRKYRPQTLDALVGQEHIKKTLSSAIELGKIAHAFLFTGPRGTGKTSTARILAKSLNCVNGPTLHPCGECESCKDITNSIPIDVIEIDAASNRSVEDAQNILEKIQYAPVHGKYKIYIIDEVHMLSTTAFNALLKTLEEPPENVIFILATTEVHKVLDTIKSRCQRFDFRRITTDDIVKRLRYISDEEKINISDDALYTIAKNSAGGMRDSISLLDQLSLLGVTKQVTSEDVNAILGRISFDVLHKLSEKIISSSINEAIEILNDIYNSGNEPLQILINLSEYFKNLLIVKNCSKDLLSDLTGLNEAQIGELLKQKDLLETQQLVFLLERIAYYVKEVKFAVNQYLWLEVGIIDLANMTENTALLDLQNRVKALEGGEFIAHPAKQNISVTRPAPIQPAVSAEHNTEVKTVQPQSENVQKVQSEDTFTPPPMSKKPDGNDIGSLWNALLANIKSPPTKAILKLAVPVKIAADEIIITFTSDKLVDQFTNTNKKDIVAEAAKVLFNNSNTHIVVRLPLAGDNSLGVNTRGKETGVNLGVNSGVTTEPAESEEKKKIVNEEVQLVEDSTDEVFDEPLEDVDVEQMSSRREEFSEELSQQSKERIESDQEKMVLDLFDGKYIE